MLSQTAGYAIAALSYVAGAGGRPVLVREVAEALSLPQPFLAKIVHQLGRDRFVLTRRGIRGGVVLARPAEEITLAEVCRAFGERAIEPECMLALRECSDSSPCPAHEYWKRQRESIGDFLGRTSVAAIAAFEAERGRGPSQLAATKR